MASWFSQFTKPKPSTESTTETTSEKPQENSTKKIGSFFSNVASKIITTLAEEKERFLNEKEEDTSVKPSAIPLWMAIQASDQRVVGIKKSNRKHHSLVSLSDFAEEARNAILGLTKSKRNFLNAPPDDASI